MFFSKSRFEIFVESAFVFVLINICYDRHILNAVLIKISTKFNIL
jgi:hypothetical protein